MTFSPLVEGAMLSSLLTSGGETEEKVKDEDRAFKMLKDNIWAGYSESCEYKRDLPCKAIKFATPKSLQLFLTVNDELQQMVRRGHYRTRDARGAIGIRYQEQPCQRGSREIQSVLLPTGPKWRGYIWAFLRGHALSPITARTCVNEPTSDEVNNQPVFKVIGPPTPELTEQLIAAFGASSLKPH